MNRSNPVRLSVIALIAMGLGLLSSNALAQQKSLKEQLVGTWTLVSVVEVHQDGRRENPWGPAVKGAVSFDGNGKVLLMIIGADLPAPSGKPQESSRMVVAYFGTYSVDEVAKTATYTAERLRLRILTGLPSRPR
jgi:Lipocalin-like domain